ncbi:uncharacterized protein LOC125224686 [Leguminivora glycinivorella]|uniref:uncharacterized protein LOC125224686 n=1 Tax=Leguminivora glycinivorella TaxID=1035111 RepID=UPI00200C22AE|nr:uncharacterized protein LOC125224686 [Leguminivora glycinivorella]
MDVLCGKLLKNTKFQTQRFLSTKNYIWARISTKVAWTVQRGRKPGKTRILTDTPVKNSIQMEELKREINKRKNTANKKGNKEELHQSSTSKIKPKKAMNPTKVKPKNVQESPNKKDVAIPNCSKSDQASDTKKNCILENTKLSYKM